MGVSLVTFAPRPGVCSTTVPFGHSGADAKVVFVIFNPLEEISNTQKIVAVIVRGKYYPRGELDKILSGIEEAAAKE